MCKCISRVLLFLITTPLLIVFLVLYTIICGLYIIFIKIPFYCCCGKTNQLQEPLKELDHTIPAKLTPYGLCKEFLIFLLKTKLCHYYLSFIFQNVNATKLVSIRRRFNNGKHQDVMDNKSFVKVCGGNNLTQFDEFITNVMHNSNKQNNEIEITFTSSDALSAAIGERKTADDTDTIAILDLASRRHVGGWGFCPYVGTQEEDLIRMSNLYWLLHPKYNQNLKQQLREKNINDSHIPYFGTVYIPNVIFLKEEEYKFDIIASAAPDMRTSSNEYKSYFRTASVDAIKSVLIKKIEAVIATCIMANDSILIAGALGCGAYKCDSTLVAQCFKQVINAKRYQSKGIKKIVFAIAYDDDKLNLFRKTILN